MVCIRHLKTSGAGADAGAGAGASAGLAQEIATKLVASRSISDNVRIFLFNLFTSIEFQGWSEVVCYCFGFLTQLP